MDSIERAIRDALAKGNARDRAYREKVYRSVLAALERANAGDPNLTSEAIAHRKNTLRSHITMIEREFAAGETPTVDSPIAAERAEAMAPPTAGDRIAPEPAFGAGADAAPAPEIDRPIRNEPASPRHAAREESIGASAEDRLSPHEDGGSRRRPYAAMFVVVTLVVALAIGAWWATETGLFGRPDTSVPNPPPELEAEDFTPAPPPLKPAEEDTPRDWVTLFDPSDPSNVTAPSGAVAELVEDDGESYLRIRSGPGGAGVLFDVPAQILAELAGRGAVFDIVASSEEGEETQISVTCNFGELGDCGRQRYLVGYEQADYLFDVDMPRGTPGSSGTIAIVSDVSNEGRAVHVFEIRVAPH